MSGWSAPCPQCGATVVFSLGTSLLKVCEHCGVAVARKGANLESYGKVAELIPTPSVLKLGLEGRYPGAPAFQLVGRLQLDWGSGTWDEWLIGFSNDKWAWLSESQGKFHYMGKVPLPPVPRFEDLAPGQTIDLGPPGVFVVIEVRSARFVTAQGELPFDVEPGSQLNYADLSGPQDQLATLDYGIGSEAQDLYVGRELALDELGFHGLPDEEERRKRTAGKALSCPQCGGPLEVRAPDQTQRVACPYCGSLLDATKGFAVLEALARVEVQPLIPLGSKGRLEGAEWTVIGFMERSVTVEGTRYPWQEYLLYNPRRGFRWLVDSNGHWLFVQSANAADVHEQYFGGVVYEGKVFKHFQSGAAVVDHVLGEFYWAVARGDVAQSEDYTCPPQGLSKEATGEEITWSLSTHKEPQEVWEAFQPKEPPPERRGVGMCQPWKWAAEFPVIWSLALLGAGIVFLLFFGFLFTGGEVVHDESFGLKPGSASGAPESAAFAGPIFVKKSGNLEVGVKAPLSNSWLYLDGALINDETGEVDEFDAELEYYFGSDSDGSWSEGSTETTRYVSSVAPGRYTLRLAPQWEAGKMPASYDVTVKSRVPRFYHALFAALALLAWPLMLSWGRMRFESARWSESDHPWFESSGSSDDDE